MSALGLELQGLYDCARIARELGIVCRCCEGSGEVVGLKRATLLARGDIDICGKHGVQLIAKKARL